MWGRHLLLEIRYMSACEGNHYHDPNLEKKKNTHIGALGTCPSTVMSTIASRDREDDEERSRSPKRARVDSAVVDDTELDGHAHPTHEQSETRTDAETEVDTIDPVAADCTDPGCVLPASHVLLPSRASPTSFSSCATRQLLERDVGITEYISQDVPPIHGIIKQR